MKNSLLVYSGGLDSSSMLYMYKDHIKLAISFDYGSRHNNEEIKRAEFNCAKLDIEHKVIDIKSVFESMSSALLGSEDIPHGHYAEDNMASTVVPFRNGIMLSIAAGIADSNKLSQIMLASHKGDNAQYPDCTPDFNTGMQLAVFNGTSSHVVLATPFAQLDKQEIAKLGFEAGMKPGLTYSCYEGKEHHCGRCGTCVERIWALKDLEDKTDYLDMEYAIEVLKEKGEWDAN